MLFSLLTAGAYFATGFEPLLLVIVLQNMEMLHQLLPFLRLDGYYIVSDLTGVPDMLTRIEPTLRSMIPGREPDARVAELKPWVRVATTVYVVTLIPALTLIVGLLRDQRPRLFATAIDSFGDQIDKFSAAISMDRSSRSWPRWCRWSRWRSPSPAHLHRDPRLRQAGSERVAANLRATARRVVLVAATVAAGRRLTALWWPNGEYTPIQPGEKGTIGGGIQNLSSVTGGTPAWVTRLPTARESATPPRAPRFREVSPQRRWRTA